MRWLAFLALATALASSVLPAAAGDAVPVLHVSPCGSDAHDGSPARPLRTIAAASLRAGPGTVHRGRRRSESPSSARITGRG